MKKAYILLLLFMTIFTDFAVFAQQSEGEFSETEQRYMTHLEPFSFQKWLDGQVQENIEATYVDNFFERDKIINWLQLINTKFSFLDNQVVGKLTAFDSNGLDETISSVKNPNPDSQGLKTEDEVANFDTLSELAKAAEAREQERKIKFYSVPLADSEISYVQELSRLIKTPEVPNDERLAVVEKNIDTIKRVEQRYPEIDFYVYLPLFLSDLPYFDVTGTSTKYLEMLKTQLNHFSYTEFDSLQNALDSYFLTDHHWNHIGGKRGYEDIIKLIYGNTVKPREPINLAEFNEVKFYGYLARRIEYSIDISDTISKYVYDLPKMNIYYNKEPQEKYGRLDVYSENRFSRDKGTDHYASLYHPREAEIVFEQNDEELDNILIFADSFSNINRDVIASHFNKTIFISPVLFKDKYGDFSTEVFEKYIKDNKINKVLYMSTLITYYDIGDIKDLFEDIQQ